MPYKDVDVQREFQRKYQQERARKPTTEEKKAYRKRYQEKYPEKYKAQRAVSQKVYRKRWPPATFFQCTDCDDKAKHYHHEDYSQKLNVEPLCHSCHAKRHHK
jgi:hypothetical protein